MGSPTLKHNKIYSNKLAGIHIRGGTPTISSSKIFSGKQCGVLVSEHGAGVSYFNSHGQYFKFSQVLEDNDIYNNKFAGIEIRKGGKPTLLSNRIFNGKSVGVILSLLKVKMKETSE